MKEVSDDVGVVYIVANNTAPDTGLDKGDGDDTDNTE